MPADTLPLSEFIDRRRRLRRSLKSAVGLLFAGQQDSHDDAPYRPHPHFEYLTGVTSEPGAVLLIDPTHPIKVRREILFLQPLNPEVEKWDGYRLEISAALRDKTGFASVFRLDKLPMFLHDAARRTKRLACLHPLALYTQPVSPDLEIFRKIAERIPGVSIEDHSDLLPAMRSIKSKREIAMMQRAVDITAEGFAAAMRSAKPGMNEFELQAIIEHAYRMQGARATAFGTIVGSGINSTVLHYRANNKIIGEGDLICIDSGAKWAGYSADVTRTIPANGKFTKRQRELYDLVLRAEMTAIKAARPGARLSDLDAAARAVIASAGLGDYFIHSIGHHLGLETHDCTPLGNQPLQAGSVITIEPGVYIPEEEIGIRIEDTVLITQAGNKVLSAAIPKKADDIERIMRGGTKRRS